MKHKGMIALLFAAISLAAPVPAVFAQATLPAAQESVN